MTQAGGCTTLVSSEVAFVDIVDPSSSSSGVNWPFISSELRDTPDTQLMVEFRH
jgi:predicted NUDIX family NTP pyrophosphohydrolase